MVKIKFSSNYPKLWGQKEAILLFVKIINQEQLTEDLIEYDTKNSKGEYYKLPKTDLIQLVFLGNKGIPFCTLRRYTPMKLKYYKDCVDKVFDVVIDG